MEKQARIAVVIPCYRVRDQVKKVIENIPSEVSRIFCVDDACPENTGDYINNHCNDPRVEVFFHKGNEGVGGAVITGYRAALEAGYDIVVKVDGDGQMDPKLLPKFTQPIIEGEADYTKGNRFYNIGDARSMPKKRLLANMAHSFFSKLSTGYWSNFDPANGYTAIHTIILKQLPLDKINSRYFFETDMLFWLGMCRCKVVDIPMSAYYGAEKSSLRIRNNVMPFLKGHLRNTGKRILYQYFLRDFHAASLHLALGVFAMGFGMVYGTARWLESIATNHPAPLGSIMLAVLPILLGFNLWLSFLHFDISNVPKDTIHTKL